MPIVRDATRIGPLSQAVRQWIANPPSPVRIREGPLCFTHSPSVSFDLKSPPPERVTLTLFASPVVVEVSCSLIEFLSDSPICANRRDRFSIRSGCFLGIDTGLGAIRKVGECAQSRVLLATR